MEIALPSGVKGFIKLFEGIMIKILIYSARLMACLTMFALFSKSSFCMEYFKHDNKPLEVYKWNLRDDVSSDLRELGEHIDEIEIFVYQDSIKNREYSGSLLDTRTLNKIKELHYSNFSSSAYPDDSVELFKKANTKKGLESLFRNKFSGDNSYIFFVVGKKLSEAEEQFVAFAAFKSSRQTRSDEINIQDASQIKRLHISSSLQGKGFGSKFAAFAANFVHKKTGNPLFQVNASAGSSGFYFKFFEWIGKNFGFGDHRFLEFKNIYSKRFLPTLFFGVDQTPVVVSGENENKLMVIHAPKVVFKKFEIVLYSKLVVNSEVISFVDCHIKDGATIALKGKIEAVDLSPKDKERLIESLGNFLEKRSYDWNPSIRAHDLDSIEVFRCLVESLENSPEKKYFEYDYSKYLKSRNQNIKISEFRDKVGSRLSIYQNDTNFTSYNSSVSVDGEKLFHISENFRAVFEFDLQTGDKISEYKIPQCIEKCGSDICGVPTSISQDGTMVGVTKCSSSVMISSPVQESDPISVPTSEYCPIVFFSPGSRFGVVERARDKKKFGDASYSIWDLKQNEEFYRFVFESINLSSNLLIRFSKDEGRFALSKDDEITLINLENKTNRFIRFQSEDKLRQIEFSDDGKKLVGLFDDHLMVWNSRTGELLHSIVLSKEKSNRIALSISGRNRIAVSSDNEISIWDLESGKKMDIFNCCYDNEAPYRYRCWQTSIVEQIAFAASDRLVVRTSGAIEIWDLKTGLKSNMLGIPKHSDDDGDFKISHDGRKLIFFNCGESVEVWDLESIPSTDEFKNYQS